MRPSQLQLIETVCGIIVQLAWLMHVASLMYAVVMETKQPISTWGVGRGSSWCSVKQGTLQLLSFRSEVLEVFPARRPVICIFALGHLLSYTLTDKLWPDASEHPMFGLSWVVHHVTASCDSIM